MSAAAQPIDDISAAPTALLDLVLMRLRLRARRRLVWLAHLGAPEPGPFDPALLACLDERDTPAAEAAFYATAPACAEVNQRIAAVEAAVDGPAGARLRRLADLFKLDDHELDVLQAALGLLLEPALGAVYAFLQRHPARSYATAPLAARLFGHETRGAFGPSSSLAMWGFVVAGEAPPGETSPLVADPQLAAWLEGDLALDGALVGVARRAVAPPPLASWPVEAAAQRIRAALQRREAIRLAIVAPEGAGRRSFAAAVAAHLDLPALVIDTGAIADADWRATWVRAQRLAILGRIVLVWHGGHLDRPWPSHLAVAPVQMVAVEDGQALAPSPLVVDDRLDLPPLDTRDRRELWLRSAPGASAWAAAELDGLVATHRMSAREIGVVGRLAPLGARAAAAACREVARHSLDGLAQLLECPFQWSDLVVPEPLREALADFAFEARERAPFWEDAGRRRLFPRGTALVALLSGPPGTGKTMAAQIIAAELGVDLYRVDLAAVVSKYVGETAKNLKRIFARAGRLSAVLFFDEADALFSRRVEVRESLDRHANTDTGYLLQLLEEYDGVALLATNRRADIDAAFVRRMRYTFDFAWPGPAERLRLWRQILEGVAAAAFDEAVLGELAAALELSGAQIKTATLAALFAARRQGARLGIAHVIRGIERELAKEGRVIAKKDRDRLVRLG